MTEIPEGMQYAMHGHAVRLRRRFPMVSHDDIFQEQALWWYANPDKVARYQEDEDEKAGERKLSWTLRNAGLAYCHRERARIVGYDVADLFFYSTALLREILPAVWDDEAWLRLGKLESDEPTRGSGGDPAEGNNAVTTLADVKRAVELMPMSHRRLIEWAFKDGRDEQWLSFRLQTTEDAARMRLQRALRRLQDELGGDRPDWNLARRSRRALAVRDHNERGAGDHG